MHRCRFLKCIICFTVLKTPLSELKNIKITVPLPRAAVLLTKISIHDWQNWFCCSRTIDELSHSFLVMCSSSSSSLAPATGKRLSKFHGENVSVELSVTRGNFKFDAMVMFGKCHANVCV